MAVLEPNDDNFLNKEDYVSPTLEELIKKLPLEKQFALMRLTNQLDQIITISEKPKDKPYSGYMRVKETDLENYRSLVKGIITQLFLKYETLDKMFRDTHK